MPLPKEAQTSPNTPQTKMFWFLGFSLGMESFAQLMNARCRRNTTSPRVADIPPYPASKDIMISGFFSGTVIAVAGDVVFTASGGR